MNSNLRYKVATCFYNLSRKLKRSLYPTALLSPGDRYFKRGGNQQLLRFNLNSDSICLDFGGYEGVWASAISAKFGCFIDVYEPVESYADNLRELFKFNPKISIHSHGISEKHEFKYLSLNGAASSSHIDSDEQVLVEFKDATELMAINQIDVIKINIEGGEYELIPELHQKSILSKTSTILIQFHSTENQNVSLCKKLMSETHECSWSYDFVWERWDRRKS